MTTRKSKSIAVLAEVVAVLARHPGLRVAPVLEDDGGVVALTISMQAEGEDGLQVLALRHELEFVANVATMRFIAREHGIDAEKLQALIPALHEDAPPHAVRHLTVQEIDVIIRLLNELDMPLGEDATLLHSALPKLVALGQAMAGGL